jgi:recombination protein RecR
MNQIPVIEQLADALRCLPGVGPKTAQRMVLHLLEHDRAGGRRLSGRLLDAMDNVVHCDSCRNFTEVSPCEICQHTGRDQSTLCIVENPADVIAIEHTGGYRGNYCVLMGTLSPLDGIGPEEIGIAQLLARCEQGVTEVILAIGSTVEGEATAHFIAESLKPIDVKISRIAHGIPLGGELEFVDGGTLSHALAGRKQI